MKEESKIVAQKDLTTGLWNKNYLLHAVDKYLEQNKNHASYAYLCFKIDYFELFNKKCGLICGDQFLEDLTNQILLLFSADDIVSRVGEATFAVFMRQVSSKSAVLQTALQLRQIFSYIDIPRLDKLTCSIGFVCYPEDLETTYQAALRAVEYASSEGVNHICFYDKDDLKIFFNKTRADNRDLPIDIFRILYEASNITEKLSDVLGLIGAYYRIGRIYIYEKDSFDQSMHCTYSWNNEVELPLLTSKEATRYMLAHFYNGDVFYCTDINLLPDSLKNMIDKDRATAVYQQIIRNESCFQGFWVLEQYENSIPWTAGDLQRLKIIGQILNIFLVQK